MNRREILKNCHDAIPNDMQSFCKQQIAHVWRIDALLMLNIVMVAVMVGIGVYGRRYRHRPFTRFLYDGATSIFLPIISYVISDISSNTSVQSNNPQKVMVASCNSSVSGLIILWTGFVHMIATNTSVMVADDDREDRYIGPPGGLFVQVMWTSYLALSSISNYMLIHPYLYFFVLCPPFVIIFAKMISKSYAFYKVRWSYALGRNPRLIVGYMEQLPNESLHGPPPLLVTGEETVHVKKRPHGYCFQHGGATGTNNMLVTIDKVWQLDDDGLLGSTTRLKDVCLSFALFKLLRCRFARYTIVEAGFHKVFNFFWHEMLKDGVDERRVLEVIEDELCFLHSYYYSSLPISYPNRWLPILNMLISLLNIGYCLFVFGLASLVLAINIWYKGWDEDYQEICTVSIMHTTKDRGGPPGDRTCNFAENDIFTSFGSVSYVMLPVCLLAALVVLTEVMEIASYVCSNWTKVALICRYTSHASRQQSPPTLQKWVAYVLQCRCKLLKHWQDKMNQCSILVLQPRKTSLSCLWHLIRLPGQTKNVKVPREVKVAVIGTLRSYNGMTSLPRSLQLQISGNLLWKLDGAEGIAHTMLVCHIATSILEVRSHKSLSSHKISATHLSNYCAYLVAYSCELLPDDDAWCKSLYKAAMKDARGVLAGGIEASTPQEKYQKLINLLTTRSNHDVLKNGAELGRQLVELGEGEEKAWEVLAGFWSEIILYAAPSDNLKGHAEAIARGGELITLLWALLAHVGIVNRPDAPDTTATAAGAL